MSAIAYDLFTTWPFEPRGRKARVDAVGSRQEDTQTTTFSPIIVTKSDGTLAEAHVLLGVGASEYRMGRPREALESLLEASRRLAELSDSGGTLEALLLVGRAERDLGLLEEASRHFGEALELARSENEKTSEVEAFNLQAGVLSSRGDSVGALEQLEQGLAVARQAGLLECQANMLNNIGNLRTKLGDFTRALESLQSAHELIRQLEPRSRSEAANLINLGHLCSDMGDGRGAQELYARAREVGLEIGDRMVEVVSLNSLANELGRSEEWSSARELYHEALGLARRLGFRQYEIDNLDGLGQSHATLGEHERAIEAHLEALSIARRISYPEGKIDALINLGRNQLVVDRADEALAYLTEALDNSERLERQCSLIDSHELLAQAYEQRGELARALHHQRELRRIEKLVLSDRSEQRSKQLAVQFELERARSDSETQRMVAVSKAREEAEAKVLARTFELEQAQMEIVSRLARAAEYRDDETGEHTWRVGCNSAAIARALGWPAGDVQLLYSAARLHDVGKIGLRDSILLKPDELSSDEFELVRAHTAIGANILSGGSSRLLRMAEEIALSHHERWDGNGYPRGLAGNDIPLTARIVAVADVFDALIHERPYKRAWSVEEALAEIRIQSGRQFDPEVVDAFFRAVREEGTRVRSERRLGMPLSSARPSQAVPSTAS